MADVVSMKGNKQLLKGGRVICPLSGVDAVMDVLLESGKVFAVDSPGAFVGLKEAQVVDASGLLVVPGFCDVHVHLREPGFEWKETVQTGAAAAVSGGYTRICCMPNTHPINDTAQVTEFILEQAATARKCRVFPIGAITKGSGGKELAPMLELREAGCVAFSDDGLPVADAGVMRRALEYSLMCETVLACHEEDKSLSADFSMNESALSLKLGLKGMPGAAEEVMIARDIELARLTRARVHFCHVTTARAALLIQRAKEDGIPVSAEVTSHHFTLTEQAVSQFDANSKMSPPLRSEEDRDAVLSALSSGVIDCIASDHAPHEMDSKNREFQDASFGIIGFQTTLPLTLAQVRAGKISMKRAIEVLSIAPQKSFRMQPSGIRKGDAADIALIDPEHRYTFTPEMIVSKSKNTPFLGMTMQGSCVATFVGGEKVYDRSKSGNA